MNDLEEYSVGFLSYEWSGAPPGVIDANSGGTALIGIDEAIRFFNRKQTRGFSSIEYQIPIKTGEGSWIAYVLGIIAIPATAFATGYAKKAGEKMAERDFSDLGFKDIARKSVDALRIFIDLVKHTGKASGWGTTNAEWKESATIVGILNSDGEVLYLPAEYLKWYYEIPKTTLRKLVAPITKGRSMIVGSYPQIGDLHTTKITSDQTSLFDSEDKEEDEFLFPELKHGIDVTLEGIITRGNQETNSIGFQYQDHILNCNPASGSIRRFKSAMFLHCRLHATVNRHVASLTHVDRRPTLIVNEVIPLESDGQQLLF
ncbi:hypothetical protein [Marilutibacter maris]|uniref:hypothetical protein n=1 Tax=Marilutibacter maris TaxID=1605891 RepID=UPI0011AEA496|nr:hypothetical protein [Lysobacter maris]